MILTLPYPPSTNNLYATVRGHRVLSSEGRKFKARVASIAATAYGLASKAPSSPVAVRVRVFRPRRAGDLDNALKAILDSLTGIAYLDDSQVVEIHASRFEDKANPRAEVEVEILALPSQPPP